VQVLCTTSTLAMGVNLPAHLVILKVGWLPSGISRSRWCHSARRCEHS